MLTRIKTLLALPKPAPQPSLEEILAFLAPPASQPKTFTLSRGPLDQFCYPDEATLDDWGKLRTRKLREEVTERYTRYSSFDICCVRDYIKDMGIPLTAATKQSLDHLKELHCVKFELVPASIFERIPHWFNHVISCGQICHPLIASNELGNVIDV
jgi:hypothetical protein